MSATITGYIPHDDYQKLIEKTLEYPDKACAICDNKTDCIGKDECFNPQYFKLIQIQIKEFPK